MLPYYVARPQWVNAKLSLLCAQNNQLTDKIKYFAADVEPLQSEN